MIRKHEKNIPGHSNISSEENDINSTGYLYPADPKRGVGKMATSAAGRWNRDQKNTSALIRRVTIRGNKLHDLHLGQSEALTVFE